jgi:hypothetical protein
MHPASDCPAVTASVGADPMQAVHPFGKPLHDGVVATHCMRALHPAAALQAVTALMQSPHLVVLHEQRSNAAPSPGGGPASVGVDELDAAVLLLLLLVEDVTATVLAVLEDVAALVVLDDVVLADDDDGGRLPLDVVVPPADV